jgi:hypothetical protein
MHPNDPLRPREILDPFARMSELPIEEPLSLSPGNVDQEVLRTEVSVHENVARCPLLLAEEVDRNLLQSGKEFARKAKHHASFALVQQILTMSTLHEGQAERCQGVRRKRHRCRNLPTNCEETRELPLAPSFRARS